MNCRIMIPPLLFAFVLPAPSQKPDFNRQMLVGSWKVNWDRSKVVQGEERPQPNLYREYEDCGGGLMLHTVIFVDPAQKRAHLAVLAVVKYDGREYPTYAGARLGNRLSSGQQPPETVSFKVVDPYNMEWTDRTSGKLTGTGTVSLSRDGKTMTDHTRGFNAEGKQIFEGVLVYEKE